MGRIAREKNVFADKATLVLRKMLFRPDKKWVTRDFTGPGGVSLGMAQGVLDAMTKKGYLERVKRGPESFSILAQPQKLVDDWAAFYHVGLNDTYTYYSPDKRILPRLKKYLKDKPYALTLHSGANLKTSFVVSDDIYFYFSPGNWEEAILDLRQQLDLKELVRGGNIHVLRPCYKHSVFYNAQKIKGYKVVSNLQLYLDLYQFKPRGKEQAGYMVNTLKEKGKVFYAC